VKSKKSKKFFPRPTTRWRGILLMLFKRSNNDLILQLPPKPSSKEIGCKCGKQKEGRKTTQLS
jgi:hypothetical protein